MTKCPECNAQQLRGVTKPVKEGYLLKHKKRIFGKDWKESWFVLYEDSTMAWYKNEDNLEIPSGMIVLKDAPEMLAVGQFTFKIPGTPSLPPGCNFHQLMAVGSKSKDTVHWLLAASEDEINEWMNAISNTLPVAPPKQLETQTREVKDGKLFQNDSSINIGNFCASMKPVLKKCKNCCSSCNYSTLYNTKNIDRCIKFKGCKEYEESKCECSSAFLMGYMNARVATGWRGWGEGAGWQMGSLFGMNCNAATTFVDHATYMSSHDLGLIDYQNCPNVASLPAAFTEEASAVLDSTGESAGILAFDFFL